MLHQSTVSEAANTHSCIIIFTYPVRSRHQHSYLSNETNASTKKKETTIYTPTVCMEYTRTLCVHLLGGAAADGTGSEAD